MSYEPVFNPKKDIDDVDDLFDEDGAEVFKTIADGINSGSDAVPAIGNGTSETVQQQAEENTTVSTRPPDMLVPNGQGGYTYKVWDAETGLYKVQEENVDEWRAGGIRNQREGDSNFVFKPMQ